jgi:hypothetical protein
LTGWVVERLKAPVLKTGRPARVSWVRIPPHPPESQQFLDTSRFGQKIPYSVPFYEPGQVVGLSVQARV